MRRNVIFEEVVSRILRYIDEAGCVVEQAIAMVMEELTEIESGALEHALDWKQVQVRIASIQFESPVTIDEAIELLSSCFVQAALHAEVTARIGARS